MSAARETNALLAWVNSYSAVLEQTNDGESVKQLATLADGRILWGILTDVDPEHFPSPSAPPPTSSFTTRLQTLTRLQASLTSLLPTLPPLNLSLLASTTPASSAGSDDELRRLVKHVLIAAVKGSGGAGVVAGIGALGEDVGAGLMSAIRPVMQQIEEPDEPPTQQAARGAGVGNDDEYYALLSSHRATLRDKETLESVYQALLDEHRSLRAELDDSHAARQALQDELQSRAFSRRAAGDSGAGAEEDEVAEGMRAEIGRLRDELQKSEDGLAEAEAVVERQTGLIEDLTRKVDDLQSRAAEATRLKDQLDEYKHAASKLQKTENVIEKYKRKLEESADLRRQLKTLEDQNASLVDLNASLEASNKTLSSSKPLLESYRTQVSTLESRLAARAKESQEASFEAAQLKAALQAAEEEREKAAEAIELLEERVRELEVDSGAARAVGLGVDAKDGAAGPVEDAAGAGGPLTPGGAPAEPDDLDVALSSTSLTDLRLQVRRLKRELEAAQANKADASRLLVLENLLEDAQRMKGRYERDWMSELGEKLELHRKLEEIRRGAEEGEGRDGPEVVLALRQRLNETVDDLDQARKDLASLRAEHNGTTEELARAKSDLTLVSKDQLDILDSLRASVSADKDALVAERDELRAHVRELEGRSKDLLERVNTLLLEKVELQRVGIEGRERMLERERDFGELKFALAGKGLSEEDRRRVMDLQEDNRRLRKEAEDLGEKLVNAKRFIKQQDKLFREEHSKSGSKGGSFEEAEQSWASERALLEEDLTRLKTQMDDLKRLHQHEQRLMLSAFHDQGLRLMQATARSARAGGGAGGRNFAPSSWLAAQRQKQNASLFPRR